MESIAQNIGGPATPRPALSQGADIRAVLQAGRVVAGHVIESHANGSVLVSIGNMRVPARAQVALEPGQRFLATVEASGEVLILRVMTGDKAPVDSALLNALRALLPGASSSGAALGELLAVLKVMNAKGGEGDPRVLMDQLTEHLFRPGARGSDLASLIQRAGTRLEAVLLAASLKRGSQGGDDSQELRRDLKARLLMARSSAGESPLADALTKAIRSIESEQVLNLARAASSEPHRFSVPFPDPGVEGAPWTTAFLTFTRRREEGSSGEDGEGEASCRFRLDVKLSKLGAVRAELGLNEGRIKLVIGVADERARALLEGALPSYLEALSGKGMEVEAAVRLAHRDELVDGEAVHGVQFLSEHHLLDESA